MIKATKSHLLLATTGLFVLAAAGCVSEKATPSAPVRDASFLGYSNPDTKQTTCGNCHVDVQAEWAQTKHASAWADLQASGHASASCNECHTTNGATNAGADTAGFLGVSADAQRFYQDVQCEACHGPGSTHVSAPGETQPIPTVQVLADHSDGCAACHYGPHDPFADQLAVSKHGEMPNWEGAAGSCQVNCHTVWGALPKFAPRSTAYQEYGTNPLTTTLPPGLTCALCHDPHSDANPAQLRFSLNATSGADSIQHACGKCHSRAPVTKSSSWTSSRGAHGVQFEVLMGNAGYIDSSYGDIRGPARHGSQDGSCATCHMPTGNVTSSLVNTGHTFEVGPCLSATATTTGGVDTSAACTEDKRDWSACATSNCHGSQASAVSAMNRLQTEIRGYVNLLWVDNPNGCESTNVPAGCVGSAAAVDTFDTGWLPTLLKHDATRAAGTKRFGTSGADAGWTVAKGARYNALTFGSPNRHGDGSFGVHNPAFVRAIMQGAVNQVRSTYATSDTLLGVPPAMQALLARGVSRR